VSNECCAHAWISRDLNGAWLAGNILDNTELISTLESAKRKAVEISEKLAVSRATALEIEETRVKYTPAARRGAVLFFVMASLASITNMYEYSLSSFLAVFSGSLRSSRRDMTLEGRLRNIIDTLTYDVYNYTCLGECLGNGIPPAHCGRCMHGPVTLRHSAHGPVTLRHSMTNLLSPRVWLLQESAVLQRAG
jgi:hypothetical protein